MITDQSNQRKAKRDHMRRVRLIERQRRRCKVFLIDGLRYGGAWRYPEGVIRADPA